VVFAVWRRPWRLIARLSPTQRWVLLVAQRASRLDVPIHRFQALLLLLLIFELR
jgi:hypothetical protein